jgi:hypothetical protein
MDCHTTATQEMICLGMYGGRPLAPGVSMLHILLWKFIVIELVQVDINNHRTFNTDGIWKAALGRLRSKLVAHSERFKGRARAQMAKKGSLPDGTGASRQVQPMMEIDTSNDIIEIIWHPALVDTLEADTFLGVT